MGNLPGDDNAGQVALMESRLSESAVGERRNRGREHTRHGMTATKTTGIRHS